MKQIENKSVGNQPAALTRENQKMPMGSDSFHTQLGLEDDTAGIRLKTTLTDGSSRLGGVYMATAANVIDLTQSASVLKRSARYADVTLVDEDERQIELPEVLQDQIRVRSIANEGSSGSWVDAAPPAFAAIRDKINAAAAKKVADKTESTTPQEMLVLEHKVRLRIGRQEHVLSYIDKSSVTPPAHKGTHLLQDLGFKSRAMTGKPGNSMTRPTL